MKKKLALILVLAVLLGAGAAVFLALKDDSAGTYRPNPSLAAAEKLLPGALSGSETRLENDEVSGFLEYLLLRDTSQRSLKIVHLAAAAGEKDQVSLYAPVVFRGVSLGVTARGTLSFDASGPSLSFDAREVRVGRLPVPPAWAMGCLSAVLPEGITVSGSAVTVGEKYLSFPLEKLGTSLRITGLQARDGGFYVRTNGLEAAGDALKNFLGGLLGKS